MRDGTRSLASEVREDTSVVTIHRRYPAFPHAIGFNGFLRALPGVRDVLVTVIGAMQKHRRQLDASQGASGPRGFAVRIKLIRLLRAQRFVTMAKRPSEEARDGAGL